MSNSSDDDDIDESLTVPVPPPDEEDDPLIEYEDEFGRHHTAPRSQVPIEFLPKEKFVDDEYVVIVVETRATPD